MERVLRLGILSSVLWLGAGCSYATTSPDGGTDAGPLLTPVARLEVNARRYGDLPGLANADFVAMRDGQGPWQVVEGAGGTYALRVADAAGKFSAFVVCPAQYDSRETVLVQATLGELPLTPVPCLANGDSDAGLGTGSVRQTANQATVAVASASNYGPGAEFIQVDYGGAAGTLFSGDGITQSVPEGYYDVLALAEDGNRVPLSGYLAHHERVDGTTLFNLDFRYAPPVHRVQVSVTSAIGNIQLLHHQSFISTRYADPWTLTTATLGQVVLFPDVLLDEGDFHGILTQYTDAATSQRGHLKLTKNTGDYSTALPTPASSTVTVGSSTPAVRLNYAWTGGPANAGFVLVATQPNVMSLAWVSPATLAGATTWAAPDLSQIPGWEAAWGPATGVSTPWTALNLGGGAAGWRQGVRLLPFNLGGFTEEVDSDLAQSSGTLTP